MKRTVLIFLIMMLMATGWSQSAARHSSTSKGSVYISWGWNRAIYTNSNIWFKGGDYNFVLYQVKAHDRPTFPVSYHNYLQPNRLTIPQTNFRMGYFIKDNLAIVIADDHMKYVMDNGQDVMMKGTITRPGKFFGTYSGPKTLTRDFLLFEHTNGLNYLNVEIEKYYTWHHSAKGTQVSGILGGGTGILYPKTDVTLMDYPENDQFHVTGFGFSARAGVRVTFMDRVFAKLENKVGYINMPDILLHASDIKGSAHQAFCYTQFTGMIGFSLNTGKKHKK